MMDLAQARLRNYLDDLLPQVSLPKQSRKRNSPKEPWTVILTGSTGSLGTNILASLQDLPPSKLRRVYCLNRSEDASQHQADALARRGHKPLDRARIVFLGADFDATAFGLGAATLTTLLAETTVIIHCAWPVDFLAPLEAFRTHLDRLRDLCQLAYRCARQPPLLFLSSLGVAYASDRFHVPEAVPRDFATISGGYSQSKYVAERMVQAYADATSLPAAVLRLGQIAGPVRHPGVWPPREWFPTMLRASRHLGYLPDSLGTHNLIDWIPLDVAARVVVEVADYVMVFNSHEAGRFLVFNGVNPRPVPWASVLRHLGDVALASTGNRAWAEMLRRSAEVDPAGTPGRKLVDFYANLFEPGRQVFVVEKQNLVAASRTARELGPVNREWVLRWLEQWGFRHERKEAQPQAARAQQSHLEFQQGPVYLRAQASSRGKMEIKAKL